MEKTGKEGIIRLSVTSRTTSVSDTDKETVDGWIANPILLLDDINSYCVQVSFGKKEEKGKKRTMLEKYNEYAEALCKAHTLELVSNPGQNFNWDENNEGEDEAKINDIVKKAIMKVIKAIAPGLKTDDFEAKLDVEIGVAMQSKLDKDDKGQVESLNYIFLLDAVHKDVSTGECRITTAYAGIKLRNSLVNGKWWWWGSNLFNVNIDMSFEALYLRVNKRKLNKKDLEPIAKFLDSNNSSPI
jgi:hypothetical protein